MKGLRLIPPNRPIVLPRRPTNYEVWARRERDRSTRRFLRRLLAAMGAIVLLGYIAAWVIR